MNGIDNLLMKELLIWIKRKPKEGRIFMGRYVQVWIHKLLLYVLKNPIISHWTIHLVFEIMKELQEILQYFNINMSSI